MIGTVVLSKKTQRALKRCPRHVVMKLLGWVDLVEHEGLDRARKIPGYHDEPLRGQRKGQRSIRLSRAWRAIYVIVAMADATEGSFIEVIEVSKHDY